MSPRHIQKLIEEVIQTFRQLRIVSAEIHGSGLPIPGQRGVLMDLSRGEQSVPALARDRGVSRQNIQKMVDSFLARGLVQLVNNAAHSRSKLVRLTPKGKILVKEMITRETAMIKKLKFRIPAADVEKAMAVLQVFRQQLRDHWPSIDQQ